eukprot:gene14060-15525_t
MSQEQVATDEESLRRLRKIRGGNRSKVTRLEREALALLEEFKATGSRDVEIKSRLITISKALKDKRDYIVKLDEEILQKCSLDEIDDEVDETTDISSKVLEIIGEIETECRDNINGNHAAINEKFLTAYASSIVGVEKEGYLNKKGNLNRCYQRRWFVLKGNLLFYFEKQGDRQPIGVIILEDSNVCVCDSDRFSFTISFFGSNTRVYVLCAFNEDELVSWIKNIANAPYNYTHMIMTELEKKLIRLKENERKAQNAAENVAGAIADINFQDVDYMEMPKQQEKSLQRKNNNKLKSSLDRNTIAGPKSFNNLLTVVTASKNMIQGVRRSKSSENLNKITVKSSCESPSAPGRKVYQSIRRKVQGKTLIEQSDLTDMKLSMSIERKNTFQTLHNRYAASIWTLIREYEGDANEDFMKF